ncbi:MAG: heat-inducible transcription repressor HrcA [Candidatus Omnitrophica bacterium]|nr:heat-inducible transcription repressor HrcA [Candidatus Omnitrophota bacterium]
MNTRLSERKETILQLIVNSFIQYPEPVGSKTLLQRSGLGVSPATIRSEMNELERLHYITHPHTSAGRLPTDKGYRYYVDHLLGQETSETEKIQARITALKHKIKSIDEFFSTVSNLISDFTSQVGVIVFPVLDELNFRYANLIYLSENKVLVVWATMSGLIKEQIVHLDKAVDPELLQHIANFMNQEFFGMPFHAIKAHMAKRISELERSYNKLATIADQIVSESIAARQERKVWIDGMSHIFAEPEFQEITTIKPLLEAFDQRERIAKVFEHDRTVDGITTTIGEENDTAEFKSCAIVRRNFYITDSLCGTLSVLGPRRMDYAKIFTAVEFVSGFVSNVFKEEKLF